MSAFNPKRHPRVPFTGDHSQRAETIQGALRERGCKCDVPRIPPCVPQPGIPARHAALRPVNWTSAGSVHTRAFLCLNRATVVQRGAYISAHPEQLSMLRLAQAVEVSRTGSHPLARSRGFVHLGKLAGSLDSQERHVAG